MGGYGSGGHHSRNYVILLVKIKNNVGWHYDFKRGHDSKDLNYYAQLLFLIPIHFLIQDIE